jgi:hypothetical protein
LIGRISFAEMTFLLLRGDLATPAHARVLDALLVASAEHGIAPPSMVSWLVTSSWMERASTPSVRSFSAAARPRPSSRAPRRTVISCLPS